MTVSLIATFKRVVSHIPTCKMSFIFNSSVCLSIVPEFAESEYRPYFRRMSNSGLTSEAQLRYILQWFGEFSELQREDFLPVLAAARSNQPEQLASILSSLSCKDKPASLFQCRIKLFNEWYPTWTEEEQDRVVKGVSEMDSDFATKLQDALQNGIKVNGHDDFFQEIIPEENKPDDIEEEETVENVIPDTQVETTLQTECVM